MTEKFATQLIAQFKYHLVGISLLNIVTSCLLLLNPILAGLFTNSLLETDPKYSTNIVIYSWLALIFIQAIVVYLVSCLQSSTEEKLGLTIRTRIFSVLINQTIPYFETRNKGDSLALIFNDGDKISSFIGNTLITVFPQVVTSIGALLLLVMLNAKAAFILLIMIAVFLVTTKLISRNFRSYSKTSYQSYSKIMSLAEETVSMIPIVKSFNLESKKKTDFKIENETYAKNTLRYQQRQNLLTPITTLIGGAGVILFIWFLSSDIRDKSISIGNIVSIVMYGTMLIRPLSSLSAVYGLYQNAAAAYDRVSILLHNKGENNLSNATQIEITSNEYTVVFSNITFSYDRSNTILKDFNLTIKTGETIALVGSNGIGKSTITKLLLQFATPQVGSIYIDDIDLKDIPTQQLRKMIGYVPQTTQLFDGTIRSNLAIAGLEVTDESMIETLAAVGGNFLFETLPNGLDTVVGEAGVRLSGGQCQRIALARALLKQPKILILDEATSMFDTESEESYVRSCKTIYEPMTVIVITHRPISLNLADRTLELTRASKGGAMLREL